jgi:acyl-CoA synthetase (AMP-forming)/AMP-acid ligase II/thioesterase domain-containing protein/acyl carrier protein
LLREGKTSRPLSSGKENPLQDDGSESGSPLTLGEAIRRNAQLFPREPAIVSSTFAPLTYFDLQRHLDTVRRQLRTAGFDRQARIGVLMPSGPEAVLAIVAVSCCAVAVPLDPRLTEAELDQRFDQLRLSALLLPRDGAASARRAAERRNLAIIGTAPAGLRRLGLELDLPAAGAAVPDEEPDPRAPAFILQTSGTTAQPKLIPFSHANMLAAAARMRAWFDLTPRDRCLSVSPPFYSHGLKVTVFTPLLTGGSVAIPMNPAVVDLSDWFDGLRPTWYSAGPTLHRAVLDLARNVADAQALHTLRFAVSGGAPLPGEVREDLEGIFGVPVLEHYGSSEAAQIAANLPPPGPNRPGTCGRPWPETVAVMGENGERLSPGEKGEIWVRGPTVTSGYLDAPDLNREVFVEGWFRTGDLGSLDEDGFLSLHGRISELINRGGEKIAPGEIDTALLRHPAVAEAAAFAFPHPRLGEDVAAAVVLHPGAQTTPAELRRFLLGELASFKIPHRLLVLDALPKGTTGKVQRRRLSEMVGAQAREPAAPPPKTTDLEADLLRLWRRLLKTDTLTMDDDFFESGGDSLLATEMLIEVERLVGHPIPETILFEAETIRQFAPRIAAQKAARPAPVFQFHADGDRPPLFFFHGDFASGGFYVRRMVHLLGPDHPIITIDPHGLHGEPIPASIEAMAADRLPHILERQASGPFLLGGQCNGALVAFEAARLLVAMGHKVEMVAMVDPPTVSARLTMRTILRLARRAVPPQRLAQTYDQLARLERILKMSPGELLAKTHEVLAESDDRLPPSPRREAFTIAMARYLPAPLDVPVVFYSASHDGRAWRRLSPDLEVIEVPGGHDYCLTTGAELLVRHLRQRIDTSSEVTARLR